MSITEEMAEIHAAERAARQHNGNCPDCDDLCESWDEDGVSCGHKAGALPYVSQPLSRVIGDQ